MYGERLGLETCQQTATGSSASASGLFRILGGGVDQSQRLRVTGDPAKGDPGGEAPDPAPHPLIYWGDLSVTGNGDLPLATQRRVESIASDRSPFAVA
jgi:hypothetical protein